MKHKILKGIFCCAFALAICGTIAQNKIAPKENSLEALVNKKGEVIDLQGEVFNCYYQELSDVAKKNITLEEFKEFYLNNDMSIRECVDMLNSNSGTSLTPQVLRLNQYWYQSYEDADYMISDNHNWYGSKPSNYTPLPVYGSYEKQRSFDQSSSRDFTFDRQHGPRIPTYEGGISAYYDYFLREGDIVWDCASFIGQDPANLITHMGMIVNMQKDGVYWNPDGSANYFQFIETIEAYPSGVRFGFLDDERILRCGTRVLRSTVATIDQVDNAIQFMFNQLGEDYNLDISYQGAIPGNSRNNWYCTLLVYCAYYYGGVNLCEDWYTTNYYGYGGTISGPITGHMIYHSPTTQEIGFYTLNRDFPTLSINGKSGTTWKINISNYGTEPMTVSYTPSMYFWGDIISHYMEYDLADIYLEPWETRTVNITENALATSILAYTVKGNEVMTTIACQLNNNTKTINLYMLT